MISWNLDFTCAIHFATVLSAACFRFLKRTRSLFPAASRLLASPPFARAVRACGKEEIECQ